MKTLKSVLSFLVMLLFLQGCHVPLVSYRTNQPAIKVPPPPPAVANDAEITKAANTVPTTEKDCSGEDVPICMAFIELDDMGELFDKAELDTALRIIRQANRVAPSGDESDPIVITFIHGWKNNASPSNDNVKGFKVALQEVYRRYKGTHRIVGIYIGWRGDLIHSYFPVAQQFSYFNREATAIRIPGATLSSALTQIASRTHERPGSFVIFVGHSFGGIVLERSLSETMASEIAEHAIYSEQPDQQISGTEDAAARDAVRELIVNSRADLVVFINPAGAATEAKQMLDFLTEGGYRYQPLRDGVDKPLVVSLSSTSDLATKVALPIGHGVPYLEFKSAGSFRNLGQKGQEYGLQCFDPHKTPPYSQLLTKEQGAVSQGSYYLSSAPHMQVLQSHLMLRAVNSTQMQVASTRQLITVDPNAISKCDPKMFDPNLKVIRTFRLADTQTCFAIQERPQRCNGTPYWIMELDPDVVPDHSTIFTERFISFLIDVFFSAGPARPMVRTQPQLVTGK
jgi:hypothetical protein